MPEHAVPEPENDRTQLEQLTESVENFQIADWIRFIPTHELPRFLGEVASAAFEGELDGDPSMLAGVLTDWIAVAAVHEADGRSF